MTRFYRPIGYALGFCKGGAEEAFSGYDYNEGIPLDDITTEITECGEIFDEWPEEVLRVYELLKCGTLHDEDGGFYPNRFIQLFESLSIFCSFWYWRDGSHQWKQSICIHISWRDCEIFTLNWWQRFWRRASVPENHLTENLNFVILDSEETIWEVNRVSPR